MIRATRLITGLGKRYKTTVCPIGPNENATIKRPMPILLLRVAQDKKTMEWQKEFSQLGYYSVDAMVHLPKHEGVDVLQYCYEDLKQLTSDLSFFPPLLISHGQTAWRIAQKYVSNKPVSGLVLVDQQHKGESLNLPSNEFEPRFPILHVNSHQDSKTPDFLEGWIDVIKTKQDQEFKELKNWMDQMGM